eukprot:Awhi_evm2s14853
MGDTKTGNHRSKRADTRPNAKQRAKAERKRLEDTPIEKLKVTKKKRSEHAERVIVKDAMELKK